jgi:hypothetical protein
MIRRSMCWTELVLIQITALGVVEARGVHTGQRLEFRGQSSSSRSNGDEADQSSGSLICLPEELQRT